MMAFPVLSWGQAKDTVTVDEIRKVAALQHPRLVMDAKDFKRIGKMVRKDERKGNESPLLMVHKSIIKNADNSLDAPQLIYKKDASGKRILHVSREAEERIMACAYAFRMTGDRKYLDKAREDMLTVCAFKDWNPSHYLDVAEMATAVSFGFDWLYENLDDATRKTILDSLRTHVLEPRRGHAFYKMTNNWNQVCNAGMVAAAVATCEFFEDDAVGTFNDMLRTNPTMNEKAYYPDGAYCEGSGYWNYGTSFEVMLLAILEKSLGKDFGISETQGFDKTMDFMVFTTGNAGKRFNFSDNSERLGEAPALWYFASRFGKAPMMFREVDYLKENGYKDRILPVYIKYVANIDPKDIIAPQTLTYSGMSENPVVMTRTGWKREDLYLGLKGGKANNSHGHMDSGSFVFDAYGSRWAMDMNGQAYEHLEVLLKSLGGTYWSDGQNSLRYQLTRINNRFHNTLTINDQDHLVGGMSTLEEVFDTPAARGGRLDMTKVFGDALEKVERTAVIADGSRLEVTDKFVSGEKEASVRWSMVTPATPQICEDGIVLTQKGTTMKLFADGSDVTWRIWSADPHDYPGNLHQGEAKYPTPVWIVGYEVKIPSSSKMEIHSVLQRIDE